MTNQSTVPHSEISRRLSILSEFLSDEKMPIKEAYENLMGLIEYSEFEYWFKRFQNNQFDLGYDTSLDEMKRRREFFCSLLGLHTISTASLRPLQNFSISRILGSYSYQIPEIPAENDVTPRISVEPEVYEAEDDSDVIPGISIEPEFEIEDIPDQIVERETDYRFNAENVSESFQINERLKEIDIRFYDEYCTMKFDEMEFRLEENGNNWMIGHKKITDTPIKFIIDHLWMVLKIRKIQLKSFTIKNFFSQNSNSENLNSILQSMLDSIDHQFHIEDIWIIGFTEDTFLSMLKHVKPGDYKVVVEHMFWRYEDLTFYHSAIQSEQEMAKVFYFCFLPKMVAPPAFHVSPFFKFLNHAAIVALVRANSRSCNRINPPVRVRTPKKRELTNDSESEDEKASAERGFENTLTAAEEIARGEMRGREGKRGNIRRDEILRKGEMKNINRMRYDPAKKPNRRSKQGNFPRITFDSISHFFAVPGKKRDTAAEDEDSVREITEDYFAGGDPR
ncbi:unnamed protein product [Caenorhabditis brenneri]